MFDFQAKLLKQAYTFWGERLPQEIYFSDEVTKKIEGRLPGKHHSEGDLPIEVVKKSLKGTLVAIPGDRYSDFNILSRGEATAGMLDGPPGSSRSKPYAIGAPVYILTGVKIVGLGRIVGLTAFPLRGEGKYNELKASELSLKAWQTIYREKIGKEWLLSEKEQKRLAQGKISHSTLAENGYNSVSEEPMELVVKPQEDINNMLRADGMTEAEVAQFQAECEEAANQMEMDEKYR